MNLIGCQMTVDLFGYEHSDFIPEVKEFVGYGMKSIGMGAAAAGSASVRPAR